MWLFGLELFRNGFIEPVFILEEEIHGIEHCSVGSKLELFHDIFDGD